MKDEIEELAKKLHEWYLEATKELSSKNYNHDAQKPYEKLKPEQQFISRYIAGKVLDKNKEQSP